MDIRPNNNNQIGGMNSGVNNTSQMPIKKEKSIGPMIAILIVVLAIIIATIYFIGAKFSSPRIDTTNTTSQTIDTENQAAATIKADDVDTLNQELDSQLKDIDFSF